MEQLLANLICKQDMMVLIWNLGFLEDFSSSLVVVD